VIEYVVASFVVRQRLHDGDARRGSLVLYKVSFFLVFFFLDAATAEFYTLSLHDALPISASWRAALPRTHRSRSPRRASRKRARRSEEHTSELQSLAYLVCRLLLEKKNRGRT